MHDNVSPGCASLQIVLLVLSQDEGLAKSVHKINVRSVHWYKEATLVDIPLGSLMFTVLLRAAHKNLIGARDVYLHSNTLAALANLAPFAVNLTSHSTNRLVGVLEAGYKRLKWLSGPRVCFNQACWQAMSPLATKYHICVLRSKSCATMCPSRKIPAQSCSY
jgi:hypothetical protein